METLGSKRKTRGGGGSGQVGFRFHPTGEELVDHYLKLKKQDRDFQAENIPEVDVCNYDPGDLAARMPSEDLEWYFFGRKDYKYKNSKRSNRTTPGGYWKITGKERAIKARRSKAVIGKKRTLTFYRRCEPKPKKTNWVMHEHDRIDSEANPKLHQKDFVICRMKKKSDEEDTSIGEVELGSCSVSNVEDHAAAVVTPGSQDNSSSTPLSSGYIELEDVLQANGTNDDCNAIQSPFGDTNYSYTNKNNISTCDEGESHSFTVSDFKNEAPYSTSQGLCALSQNDIDSLWLHVTQESPTCVISKNNVSTNDDDEQFKNTVSNFENQATNKRISEVCPPPEEDLEFFFDLPQIEDYTLYMPMKTTVGDVLHDKMSLIKSDDEEWYFYNRPIYKKNSRHDIERATSTGFWKITGRDKIVTARDNKTIGKKRILTFYRGRGRNAQITPWVMHEFYIPQISPNANRRDFVLCHVKKKSGKNTDVATCDEGESSNHNNAPDFENRPQAPHNMGVEEEHNQPPQNLDIFQWHMGCMLANAHDNNDYYGTQSARGANERDENSDEEFVNTLIVDPYQDSSEGMTHTNVFNDSTLPEPPRKMYLEDCGVSSDSDTQVQHQAAQGPSLQMLSVPQASSSHFRREEGVMLRNQTLRQAASSINVLPKPQTDRLQSVSDEDSGTHQITSRLRCASRPINALELKSASSVDVDAVSHQINSIQLACNEYYNNERTRRRTYPTSALVAQGKPNELEQQQSKAKEAAERQAAVDFPPKRNFITESNKDAEAVQGNNTEKGLKQTHNATTAGNWMSCSFISWETFPPLTSPPSVYLFNTVLGAILFFVFAWEVVLYGQWR